MLCTCSPSNWAHAEDVHSKLFTAGSTTDVNNWHLLAILPEKEAEKVAKVVPFAFTAHHGAQAISRDSCTHHTGRPDPHTI
jgi:hypothetical protein